jgi:hypothetical protein
MHMPMIDALMIEGINTGAEFAEYLSTISRRLL